MEEDPSGDSVAWKEFEEWVSYHGMSYPLVTFLKDETKGRVGIANQKIRAGTSLIGGRGLPLDLALTEQTAKSSPMGRQILEALEENPETKASVFDASASIMYLFMIAQREEEEWREGTATSESFIHWGPYLRSLPRRYSDPLWWTKEEVCNLLEGTNVKSAVADTERKLREVYQLLFPYLHEALPDLLPSSLYTWENFLWARSACASRAYSCKVLYVGGYRQTTTGSCGDVGETSGREGKGTPGGKKEEEEEEEKKKEGERKKEREGGAGEEGTSSEMAMFPLLDMFNHHSRTAITWAADSKFLQFRAETDIQRGAEIFNNYGPKGNEELLMGYGFCTEDNPDEVVSLRIWFDDRVPEAAEKEEILRSEGLSLLHHLHCAPGGSSQRPSEDNKEKGSTSDTSASGNNWLQEQEEKEKKKEREEQTEEQKEKDHPRHYNDISYFEEEAALLPQAFLRTMRILHMNKEELYFYPRDREAIMEVRKGVNNTRRGTSPSSGVTYAPIMVCDSAPVIESSASSGEPEEMNREEKEGNTEEKQRPCKKAHLEEDNDTRFAKEVISIRNEMETIASIKALLKSRIARLDAGKAVFQAQKAKAATLDQKFHASIAQTYRRGQRRVLIAAMDMANRHLARAVRATTAKGEGSVQRQQQQRQKKRGNAAAAQVERYQRKRTGAQQYQQQQQQKKSTNGENDGTGSACDKEESCTTPMDRYCASIEEHGGHMRNVLLLSEVRADDPMLLEEKKEEGAESEGTAGIKREKGSAESGGRRRRRRRNKKRREEGTLAGVVLASGENQQRQKGTTQREESECEANMLSGVFVCVAPNKGVSVAPRKKEEEKEEGAKEKEHENKDTGRDTLAEKGEAKKCSVVPAGEALLSIPRSLLITAGDVRRSKHFEELFGALGRWMVSLADSEGAEKSSESTETLERETRLTQEQADILMNDDDLVLQLYVMVQRGKHQHAADGANEGARAGDASIAGGNRGAKGTNRSLHAHGDSKAHDNCWSGTFFDALETVDMFPLLRPAYWSTFELTMLGEESEAYAEAQVQLEELRRLYRVLFPSLCNAYPSCFPKRKKETALTAEDPYSWESFLWSAMLTESHSLSISMPLVSKDEGQRPRGKGKEKKKRVKDKEKQEKEQDDQLLVPQACLVPLPVMPAHHPDATATLEYDTARSCLQLIDRVESLKEAQEVFLCYDRGLNNTANLIRYNRVLVPGHTADTLPVQIDIPSVPLYRSVAGALRLTSAHKLRTRSKRPPPLPSLPPAVHFSLVGTKAKRNNQEEKHTADPLRHPFPQQLVELLKVLTLAPEDLSALGYTLNVPYSSFSFPRQFASTSDTKNGNDGVARQKVSLAQLSEPNEPVRDFLKQMIQVMTRSFDKAPKTALGLEKATKYRVKLASDYKRAMLHIIESYSVS